MFHSRLNYSQNDVIDVSGSINSRAVYCLVPKLSIFILKDSFGIFTLEGIYSVLLEYWANIH